ncbi:MAG: hypothetical protein AAB019_06880 [Planctomycetota bacterium]
MVVFCNSCKVSLPVADILIKDGQELASPYYLCPACNNPAGELSKKESGPDLNIVGEIVIRDSKIFRPA